MTDANLWRNLDRQRLVGLCAAISGDRQAADDLAQETLLEAWRHRQKLVDAAGFEPWVAAIARNVCRRWSRERGRRAATSGSMPIAIDARDPVDLEMEVERAELADLVDRALRALPQTSREVMRRRYLDDLSIGEIAERSGSSPDAISMRLTRGKAALRRLLAGEMRDDAESLGLVPPDVGRWTPTRVPCTQCGLGTLLMRIEPPPGAIAFRCARCDPSPSALAIVYPLSSPDFARLLHGLVRPTAILRRADAWSHAYYAGGMESGAVPCARCGATVPLRTYERDDVPAGIARRGLYADCAVCGLQISSSVSALTLVQPQARAFRRSHPRVRSMPSRDIESRGRPAVVVGYQAVGSNARLDAVFAADSLRLLEVHAPSPNAA